MNLGLLAVIFIKHMEKSILETEAKQSWAQRWRITKLITQFESLESVMLDSSNEPLYSYVS